MTVEQLEVYDEVVEEVATALRNEGSVTWQTRVMGYTDLIMRAENGARVRVVIERLPSADG